MELRASSRGRPIASFTTSSTGRRITPCSLASSKAKRRQARKSSLVPMSRSIRTPIFVGANARPCGPVRAAAMSAAVTPGARAATRARAGEPASRYKQRVAVRRRRRPAGRRWLEVLRWLGVAAVVFVLGSVLSVLSLRWVNPLVTPLMLIRLAQGAVHLRWVGIDHRPVPLARVSPALLRAVIAAEDAHFLSHWGVDVDALRKARAWNERHAAQGRVRGASTITMQCARNVFLWQGRTYVRKALEIWFTGLMELFWSKRRILEVYLNVIEWGPGIYGAQAASERYFGVPASRLDARQAALLAAVLPNPLRRSPAAPSPSVARRATMIARRADRVRLGPLRARDPGARRTVSAPRARATARRDPEGARLPAVSR